MANNDIFSGDEALSRSYSDTTHTINVTTTAITATVTTTDILRSGDEALSESYDNTNRGIRVTFVAVDS